MVPYELMRCPNCKRIPDILHVKGQYFTRCEDSGCVYPSHALSKDSVIRDWNYRVNACSSLRNVKLNVL